MITQTKKSMQQEKSEAQQEAESTINDALKNALESLSKVVESMPYQPRTSGQRSLMNVSGTPQEFARACYNAFRRFEITYEEAQTAINKYRDEWEKS